MLGQLCAVPDAPGAGAPDGAVEPDPDDVDGVLEDGVVVLLVAALAATAPPATRAPETARTAAAFRMGLIFLTSSKSACGLRPVSPVRLRPP
jgi:hypothetical protein